MITQLISPQLIDLPAEAKKVSADAARALAESFEQIGQRQPIELIATGDRYRLVFGAKRLAACVLLNTDVMAVIRRQDEFASEAEIRLTSISENFYRHDLTVLERSVDVADWCTIWRAAHPTKPGRKSKAEELSANLAPNSNDDVALELADHFSGSFSEAAQRFLNITRREVFRSLKIASIPADLREPISLHDDLARNQAALLEIATQPYERAARIVELLVEGKVATVADAIVIIDELPKSNPPAPWEKLNDRFTRLKPTEQEAFFAIHEAAILRWIADRKAARR